MIVVKCGTGGVDAAAVCAGVAELCARGEEVVLVHGGADDIDDLATRLGVPQRTLVAPDGVTSRYTDDATLDVVVLALAGRVKPRLVAALAARGVAAIGMTGLDARLLVAIRKRAHRSVIDGRTVVVRDDRSGKITRVDAAVLRALLAAGLVPVVSPPAIDEDHRPVNVDADRAAAAIAVALRADHLVLLTAAAGVLADPSDERTVVAGLVLARERAGLAQVRGAPGIRVNVGGGMGLKLVAAREALAGGVGAVTIADGRVASPIDGALAGAGTRVSLSTSVAKGDAAWAP